MKIAKLRYCCKCGRHCRNRIFTFEGRDYCEKHWRDRLEWDEQRSYIVEGVKSLTEFHEAVHKLVRERGAVRKGSWQEWEPYIQDLCGLAEYGLAHGDKKIFVYWFTRAVWAWALKEET